MKTQLHIRPVFACGAPWRACLSLLVLAAILAVAQPTASSASPLNVPTCAPPALTRLYVNASVVGGTGDGSSWANAFKTLTAALAAAPTGPNLTEIWVAKGTYKPADPNGDRSATFQLKSCVAVYGGFTAGQMLLSQRNSNPSTNGTVLSGDLNGDDGPSFANNGENSYHVVTGSGTDNSAVLDGFTVSGGNANGDWGFADRGGGMLNWPGSPTLMNVTFSGNSAKAGGGMYDYSSNATLTNVTFSGNSASSIGGGMDHWFGSATLTNVTFSDNSASYAGGGMKSDESSMTLTNVTFSGNSASQGGGMHIRFGSPTLANVTFRGNSANIGGGMMNMGGSPTLANVTFNGNVALAYGGGGMQNEGGSPTLANVTFNGNVALAYGGGGMQNRFGSATLTNVTFSGNSADNNGGGLNNGGLKDVKTTAILTNVTFSGNSTGNNGGGMANDVQGSATLTNVTFSGNSAAQQGGGVWSRATSVATVTNSILWGDTPDEIVGEPGSSNTVSFSIVKGSGGAGLNNLDADPKFAAPITAAAPTTTGNLRLKVGSPAINAGSNAAVPSGVTADLDGNARVISGTVDMGAYEYQPYTMTPVSPTVGPPSVNSLYPMGMGPWTTTAKWKLTDGAGAAVTAAGTVGAMKYTSMLCGGQAPPSDGSFPMAGLFSSTNPRYDAYQQAWLFNWQLPGRNACYALYVQLGNGQRFTFLYNIH